MLKHLAAALAIALLQGILWAAPATQPATKPAQLRGRVVTQPFDFVLALPAELAPGRSRLIGWDDIDVVKVKRWLRDNAVGTEVELTAPLKEAKYEREPSKSDPLQTIGYTISLAFDPAPGETNKEKHQTNIQPVQFLSTEDVARASRRWQKGETVTMHGLVKEIVIETATARDEQKGSVREYPVLAVRIVLDSPRLVSVGKWRAPAKP